MRIAEIYPDLLTESPLPDDWDSAIFSQNVSFEKRIAYAKEKAQYLATGSSRSAFMIPYKGRKTILKIAKNNRGGAQSAKEVQILNDYYLVDQIKLAIPIIDYDERSSYPTWIHMEYADKVKDSDFISETGLTLAQLISTAEAACGRYQNRIYNEKVNANSALFKRIVEYFSNYDVDKHQRIEMTVVSNWGRYKGRIVMVDMGIDTEVFHSHYTFRGGRYR